MRRDVRSSLANVLFTTLAISVPLFSPYAKETMLSFRVADIRWPEPRLPKEYQPTALTKEQVRSIKFGDRFRECARCPEMVVLDARQSRKGSSPKTRTAPRFAIGRFEITFAEWAGCVAHSNCRYIENPQGKSNERYPVSSVSRTDAETFTRWLSQLTGGAYRLPTNEEWDHAANFANNSLALDNGAETDDLRDLAWFAENSGGHAHPVGKKNANQSGLHDMFGNVWEWTSDCFGDAPEQNTDTLTKDKRTPCKFGVRRGGSWFSPGRYLKPDVQLKMNINGRVDDVGFRVVREMTSGH